MDNPDPQLGETPAQGPVFADPEPDNPDDTEVADEGGPKPSTRARASVELFLRGASPGEIAELQGYASAAACLTAIESAIAWLAGPPESYAAAQRKLGMQYDLALKSLAPKALHMWVPDPNGRKNPDDPTKPLMVKNEDHIAYMKEWRATLQAKAQLFGLNAPTRLQIDTPEAAKVDEIVAAVVALKRGETPPSGDIFETLQIELTAGDDGVYRRGEPDGQ